MGCIDYGPCGVNDMRYEYDDASVEIENTAKVEITMAQQALFAVEALSVPDGVQYQPPLFDLE